MATLSITSSGRPLLALAAVLVACIATRGLNAQQPVFIPDQIGPTVQPVVEKPGFRPVIPQPPRALTGEPPPHTTPAIPQGPQTPQNQDPQGQDINPNQQGLDNGQFRFFSNRQIGVNSTSNTGEPSAAQIRDTVLQTGNWYAGLSKNSGRNFQEIAPSTFFSQLDGGFCCDQRVLYVRSHDIMVWLLQYSYSGTTQQGSYRIAVAKGRDAVHANNSSQWRSYIYNPGSFGMGTGKWLDFPDIAASNGWLHISTNVYDANRSYVNSVRFRLELADLAAGRGASMSYSTASSLGGGFAYRFAEGGNGSAIYFAAFKNTTTLYIWRNLDSNGGNIRWERTVNNWTNSTASCPGPDSRDWCGRVVGRLRGAFGDSNRVGFIWTSAGNGGSRPLPYSRIVTFDVGNNMNKLSDNDQWSSALTWAYGAARSNSRGHIGIVFAVGGPNSYVHSSGTIVDQYQTSFGAMSTVSMGSGTHGPSSNRWGDYFDVQRHPTNPSTFVGTGMQQNGSSSRTSNNPRYVWFGRDDYQPTLVNLAINSTGVTGVPITLDIRDWNGNQNGSTNMTRTFAPRQGVKLTAPMTHVSGSTTYLFERWAHKVTPTAGFSLKPIGERTLAITDVGNVDDVAEARYLRRRTLTVSSINPTSRVTITVSPNDINGNGNGSTAFTRQYRNGTSVSLTAPSKVGFNDFHRWTVNGSARPVGVRTLTRTMTTAFNCRAEYYDNRAGSAQTIGAGCLGSTGIPAHSIQWPSGQQGPQQGTRTSYVLASARSNTFSVLHIGLSKTQWGSFPLPLALDFIGMTGCKLFHDLIVSPGTSTDLTGRSSFNITWPVLPAAVGLSIYTTWAVVDIGANPLGVVHSNAMETVQGGNR